MRNKLRRSGIAALALVFCSLSLQVRAEEHGIVDLYKLAKAKDPTVSRAAARLESSRAGKDLAWAGLMPRVSANGSLREIWHETRYYQTKDINGNYTGYSYGGGVAFPLMNLPSYYQLIIADDGIKSADYGVETARQDLITRLVDAYVMFLKAKADEKLYRDELSRVGKVLEQTEAFLKAGTGDVIAVYEAKARLDSAAADLVKTEGTLRLAQQNLSILTGVTVDAVRDITIPSAIGPQPVEMEWWLETMLQRHPALLQARTDLRQAEDSTVAARSAHYPTLDGNGGYTVDKGSTFLPKVETSQWYVGGRINVPIYSGGETSARIRSALAGEAERRALRDDIQERATRRLKEAYVTLQYNVSLAAAYQRKNESAALQLKAIRKGREIGTRTAIDLLNAEQSFALSQRDLTNARYDNVQRRLELHAAAGILSESDLMDLSGMVMRNDPESKP